MREPLVPGMTVARGVGSGRLPPPPWRRVVFSAEVDEGTGLCPECGGDYTFCPCPGPTMDELEYQTLTLGGRPVLCAAPRTRGAGVEQLYDVDEAEEADTMNSQNNAVMCGHFAVLSLFILNLGALGAGSGLAAFGALAAPASWWLAQLGEADIVPTRVSYLTIVAMQLFAAATFLAGAI